MHWPCICWDMIISNCTKMPRSTMTMGKDAIVSCLSRFLHPRQVIGNHFINTDRNFCLEDLRVSQWEPKKTGGKYITCRFMVSLALVHNGGPVELHAHQMKLQDLERRRELLLPTKCQWLKIGRKTQELRCCPMKLEQWACDAWHEQPYDF